MAAATGDTLDRLKLTDERLVELVLALVATVIIVSSVAWLVKGQGTAGTVRYGYLLGGVFGFAVAVLIFRTHWLGLVGGISYLSVRMADVAATSPEVDGLLETVGLFGVALVFTGLLLLCRDAFLERQHPEREPTRTAGRNSVE